MLHRNLRTAAHVVVTSARILSMSSAIALFSTSPASAGTNQLTLLGPEGGEIRQVQFHPTNPSIAYALTGGGYYRSTDSGLNWSLVGQGLNLQFSPSDLAVDPSNPDRVIVAWPGQTPLVSTDAGATLVRAGTFPFVPADVRHIEFSADGSVVYAASGVKIVRSTDSGRTWTERTPVTANSQSSLQFLRVDPLDRDVVYVVDLNQGGFRSADGAGTWQPIPALPANTIDIAISSTTPQRIWAASFNTGLHRSTDGGATWPSVFPGGGMPAAVTTIALDPRDPSVVYAYLSQHGVFRTPDGNGWANVTFDSSIGPVHSIAINPLDSARVMFGSASGVVIGVPETTGAGGTWEYRNRGILATNAGALSASPSSGRVYVNTFNAGVHFLADGAAAPAPVDNVALQQLQPNPTQVTTFGLLAQSRGSDRLFVGMAGGYARSDDGGNTWQHRTGTGDTVLSFADSTGNPDVIVASTSSSMHRSTDGGSTWMPANTGLPMQAAATAMAFSTSAPNTAFAGIETFGGGPRGVYKSIDGGSSWIPSNSGFDTSEIRGLAVHPTNAQVVYAAANANGLLRTTDGGASWTRLDWPDGPGNTLAVALDPQLPNIVYAAGMNAFARSVDAGATWQALRASDALPEWHVNALLADPRRAATLLVSTFSHGLAEITIAPNLVLETGGSSSGNPLAPGAQATYRYRVRNAGQFHATGARAVVTLPADATSVSATTTNGTCAVQGATVTCTATTLNAAAAADIAVTSTHPAPGTIEVHASVRGDQPDPQSADNEVRYTVTVAQPVNPPPSGGSGGGGGGSSSLLGMLALATLRFVKSRRKSA